MNIKFELHDKGINIKDFNFVMMCLSFTCGCCLSIGILGNINLYFDLSKEATENLIWQMLPESITLFTMILCCICIMLILKSVKRNQIFTHKNAAFIMVIGGLIELNGLTLGVLSAFSPIEITGHGHTIYILIGLFFLFIGCVFKLGVKMKEEQELTI